MEREPIPPRHGEPAGPGPMPRCPHCATVIDTYLAAGAGDGKGRCPTHGFVSASYGDREQIIGLAASAVPTVVDDVLARPRCGSCEGSGLRSGRYCRSCMGTGLT